MNVRSINCEGNVDLRPVMEWEVTYQRLDPAHCTYCGLSSRRRTDTFVTKHRWGNRPEGQIVTRCPEHQAQHEQQARAA